MTVAQTKSILVDPGRMRCAEENDPPPAGTDESKLELAKVSDHVVEVQTQAEKVEMLKGKTLEEYVAMVMGQLPTKPEAGAIREKLSEGRNVRITIPPDVRTDEQLLEQRSDELEDLRTHSLSSSKESFFITLLKRLFPSLARTCFPLMCPTRSWLWLWM